jgi:hypothetical protein
MLIEQHLIEVQLMKQQDDENSKLMKHQSDETSI